MKIYTCKTCAAYVFFLKTEKVAHQSSSQVLFFNCTGCFLNVYDWMILCVCRRETFSIVWMAFTRLIWPKRCANTIRPVCHFWRKSLIVQWHHLNNRRQKRLVSTLSWLALLSLALVLILGSAQTLEGFNQSKQVRSVYERVGCEPSVRWAAVWWQYIWQKYFEN